MSSVDGVGTKLKIAFAMDKHDTIGADLVNHCVNDIAVLGAEPLFFLDYLGTGKLEPHVFTDIIKGFARACAENNCALIGGETAQMPGFYQKGEYDVSGTIVGVVEKSRMLNGQKTVRRGDVVIGIASSGLHTNGYSLGAKNFLRADEAEAIQPRARIERHNWRGIVEGPRQLRPAGAKAHQKIQSRQRSGVSAERRRLKKLFAAVCRRAVTGLRPHHRRRVCGQHPARAARVA